MFSCCLTIPEKIKVSCAYCNTSPYFKYTYIDLYDSELTIKELKKIILDKINKEPLIFLKYYKIHFINIKNLDDNISLGSFKKKELEFIYDFE
jgi:hypothetical protein